MSHLRRLLPEMHREYHNNVSMGRMCYEVFAQQFVDGRLYIESNNATERNNHNKAIRLVEKLLTSYRELAEDFFQIPTPTNADVERLIASLFQGRSFFPEETFLQRRINKERKPSLRCKIADNAMPVLADCAVDACLFKEEVTPVIIRDLLHDRITEPLTADNIQGVAYLFHLLYKAGFIQSKWQNVLERDRSILKRNGEPQKASDYSSALRRAKSGGFDYKPIIDAAMELIQRKYSN